MKIKQQILIIAILSATLIFLIRLFETRFLSGQLSTRFYISIIGIIFLAVGIWFGFSFTKNKTVIKIVEKEPEVIVNANEILTGRETELLALIAKGLSNKEIADRLFVSENTVKKHLNNVYAKLDVTRRTQAILKAKQIGIISA
ncbi:MAG: response regulator transcription factor [Ferruginibacter sp.]